MERLCKEDRKDLVWAMRRALLEQINTGILTESADASARNFIFNEATYEQLLNLCFNENREEKYLPASILEQVAVGVYENFVNEDDAKPTAVKRGVEKVRKFVEKVPMPKSKLGKAALATGVAVPPVAYGTYKYLQKRAKKKAEAAE